MKKKFAKCQLWIAIGTLVLTPITTSLIVNSQLAKAQEIWISQQAFDRSESILEKRIELMEDLNKRLLRLEVTAKKIKIDNASISSRKALRLQNVKPDITSLTEDLRDLHDVIVSYHYDLAEFAARSQMALVYFGPKVIECIDGLRGGLQRNFSTGPESFEHWSDRPSDTETGKGAENQENSNSFDTIDELKRYRMQLLDLMMQDIKESYQIYPRN